jgi:hypothetical protein
MTKFYGFSVWRPYNDTEVMSKVFIVIYHFLSVSYRKDSLYANYSIIGLWPANVYSV